ncbi:host specificity protein J [Acinetobacter towneri]|uniref:host specificity protein J n=1 Tax=Acinetobacter towneri TaxID=202956 RepID=UPI0025787A9E|nr:phage tail protein [Acinetobacter towneri]MDM1282424.1 host specificity protein J [Acinetobacter towneri]
MSVAIKGAKKGGGSSRKPVVAPDSAQSKTFIKIMYGLSEGKVKGLLNGYKSIYLDDTPLHDASGNWNFQNVQVDFRYGTNDQTYIEGFPSVESETGINVELKSDAPWVQAFSNTELDAVRVRLKWGPIRKTNAENGDISGHTIKYAIDVQTGGGAWTEVLNTQLSDKTSANYERSHRIDLPKTDIGWQIRVRRITPNSTSEYISDKMYVQAVTEIIDAKLRYPNTALLGLQYDAETFSNVAKLAVEMQGVEIRVPTNYDPETRTYLGFWDGTFKRAYTDNPAWHFYDACISKRYALGDRIDSSMIDKWSVYRLAQYCDQLVSDGKGEQEPRFTLNVYEQQQDDAWAVLSKMAGAFRAYIYWDGQAIVCDADIPQDTYFTYTRANVIDGIFEYSGTRARDRHTVAKVAWDNPKNRYKTEHVIVRDEAAIAKLGIRIVDIQAYGCTSEGQAQRAGQWALKSEQLETRTVSFKVGLDGFIPMPGKVIEVADELFAGRANGGRISAVSADRKTITVDRDDVVCRAGDRLVVNGEDGKAQARIVSSKIGRKIAVTVPFDSVAAQNIWVIDAQDLATMKFRVISITQDDKHQFSITALQYNPQKYDAIDHGAFIDDRPISIVSPTTQAAVTDVQISSETMVQQGLAVETMLIHWTQASGATKYQVEWRKDNGNWIKMPLTGNNSVEVQGIYSGNYEARVIALSAYDVASLPTYSVLTTLSGKTGLPPALANLAATGILFGYRLDWNFPAVGALDTAYTEIEIATTANGANAAQLGLFAYPTSTNTIQGMQPNLTSYFRGRLIDRIGNIGPWSGWVGATTSADASAVLDILSGKLTETQLHQDLQSEIAKIDENTVAISQEAIARTAAIASEAQLRATAISTEKTERQSADSNLSQRIDTVSASTANNAAAIATESTARADADSALTTQISIALSEADDAKSLIIAEQQTRADADSALGSRIDTFQAQIVDEVTRSVAAIQQELDVLADADGALTSRVDTVQSATTAAQSTANAAQQAAEAAATAAGNKGEVIFGSTTPTAEKRLSQNLWIDTTGGLNTPKRWNGSTWVAVTDKAATDAAAAASAAQATATEALNKANTATQNIATVQTQVNTLTTQQSATASQVSTLQTTVGGNTASIQTVSESVDGLYAQKYIKLDVSGKVAGWGGANTGKESNFIVNFDSFAIGSGGSTGYYPFIFRSTPYTDLNTGTVFPVGAYMKAAFIDYASIKLAHIDTASIGSLSAISANLGTMVSYANPSNVYGARTVIKGDVIEVYDNSNRLRVRLGRW